MVDSFEMASVFGAKNTGFENYMRRTLKKCVEIVARKSHPKTEKRAPIKKKVSKNERCIFFIFAQTKKICVK